MKLAINVLISFLLLLAVFFVANQDLPNANASTTQVPGIMVESVVDGHVRLHGSGFRPGSLVTLALESRSGGQALSSTNAWVDSRGTFIAEFDALHSSKELASANSDQALPNPEDLVVLASASSGAITVPLQVGRVTQ